MPEIAVLAEDLAHPEGPDVLPDGRLVFVETFRGRVSAWDERTGVTPYATTGGGPNACMVGTDGIYVTQNGGTAGAWRSPSPTTPAIEKISPSGTVEVVATTASGEPLHAPNDLAFGPDGHLYFTDPGDYDPDHPIVGRLCAIHPGGQAEILAEVGPTYPNGIVAEPDGSIVWGESYSRAIRRLRPDGSIELLATLPDGHIPDGMKIASDGSLYIATVTSGGIDVLSPDGARRSFVETGGEPQNCVFVGASLVITDFGEIPQYGDEGLAGAAACGRLLRLDLGIGGMALFRGAVGL
jgi:gluconolactonase